MGAEQHVDFAKWEGAGNDFILVDGRRLPAALDASRIAAWCDRRTGIGADGVIVLRPLAPGVWEADYRNADGSRSFCANGTRAAFAYLRGHGETVEALEASDGTHAVRWDADRGLPGVELRPVAAPRFRPPMTSHGTEAASADTGSPHHVEFLAPSSALATLDVAALGAAIRHDPAYAPAGTNVNFVGSPDGEEFPMRTFERGVEGETRACGTGATAAALADYARRGGAPRRRVRMAGGDLEVSFDPAPDGSFRHVWLFGPAREAFRGTVHWLLALLLAVAGALPSAAAPDAVRPTPAPLSDAATVSLLTGSPGQELWSAWGHTAIRITDPASTPPYDMTYNYGTFAFGPGFYARFLRGHLDYRLSAQPFADFVTEYTLSGRALLEQPLDLAPDEVRALAGYLKWNAHPENATYRYAFFGDNCSSRVLTVLAQVFGDRFEAGCRQDPALANATTYRQAEVPYSVGDAWVHAGIQLALGPRADRPMPPCGSSFLPDGLMAQIQYATLDGRPLAAAPTEYLPPEGTWHRTLPTRTLFHPLTFTLFLLALSLLSAASSLIPWRRSRLSSPRSAAAPHPSHGSAAQPHLIPHTVQRRSRALSPRSGASPLTRFSGAAASLPLVLAGLLGTVLTAAWVATDHVDLHGNWNLLWASPLLLVAAIPAVGRRAWGVRLRQVCAVGAGVWLVAGWALPQTFPGVLLPWALAVFIGLQPWNLLPRRA
jgi:diaminopimelate epimerase